MRFRIEGSGNRLPKVSDFRVYERPATEESIEPKIKITAA
jgi:hypothetical protein